MVKQILALVSLLLLATACAEDSVLYLEGPDKVTLDETVVYIATVENAPPVVSSVQFDWWIDFTPSEDTDDLYLSFGGQEIQVDREGVASDFFQFDTDQLPVWLNELFDLEDLADEVMVGVRAEVFSGLEAEPAVFETGILVEITE